MANKRTAVLVTGSRDWLDYDTIHDRLKQYPVGTILIHGDCGRKRMRHEGVGLAGIHIGEWKGADKIAHDICKRSGFNCWPLPYFDDLNKAGGPKRNECMVQVLGELFFAGHDCYVEAFPIGDSPGTRGCLNLVKRKIQSLQQTPDEVIFTVHVTEGTPCPNT